MCNFDTQCQNSCTVWWLGQCRWNVTTQRAATFLKSLNWIQKRQVWGWLSVWVFWVQSGHDPLIPCLSWKPWCPSGTPNLCHARNAAAELGSPIPFPAWLFLWYEELWGWLGELMLVPIQSWPSSHLPCSHPTHRTPVGVPATEVGRKPRKKHSSSSFFPPPPFPVRVTTLSHHSYGEVWSLTESAVVNIICAVNGLHLFAWEGKIT